MQTQSSGQIQSSGGPLSAEESIELEHAQTSGPVSVHLYRGGVFSEPDFVRFGVLQRLEIRGLLDYRGLSRQNGDMSFTFALPEGARIAA
jgi:hypothetical protein